MEYVAWIGLGILFVCIYALILPYKRDFEGMVSKLEKQQKARLRFY